jgi:hypothetical protein
MRDPFIRKIVITGAILLIAATSHVILWLNGAYD